MASNEEKIDQLLIQCDICGESIPKSAALAAEGIDYVFHFCSQTCLEKWKHESKTD